MIDKNKLEALGLSSLVAVADLETLSRKPNAVIGSIGCVIIDLLERKEVSNFYVRIDLDTQPGRDIESHTVKWWHDQQALYPMAYNELYDSNLSRIRLPIALQMLGKFLNDVFDKKKIQLFGNGPEFDNVILANAYDRAGLEVPWHHGGNQSIRTVVLMGRLLLGIDPKYDDFDGIKHHALHDARHEALYTLDIFSQLDNAILKNESFKY
ncbi:3'-5' exonuclease [Photobacterium damselae]|uniref:3'-5' exonuclease n=1 Tax=Photobacterium damselae TaxID=38293 RepID=UPI000D66723D|nr:3'-5' exonuclease [Photobacterium damselae]AWK83546.1 hypothetical protein BST98_16095 [Photobacterium damselae]